MSEPNQGRRRRTPIQSFEPTLPPLPGMGQPARPAEPAAAPAIPVRDATVEQPPATASPASAPSDGATATPAGERSTLRRKARKPRAATTADRPGLAVRCYPDVDELWEAAHERGASYRQILFDALEATADELPDLIVQQRQAQEQRARAEQKSRLFAIDGRTKMPEDTLGETRVMRISAQYHDVIRRLQQQVGARTPNEMYNAALRAHLGGTRP